MRFLFLSLIFLAFQAGAPAQSWKSDVVEISPAKSLSAPDGHTIHSSPGGAIIKRVSGSETVRVKASVEHGGKTYYMSDWSWNRYRKGQRPNWICVLSVEAEKAKKEQKSLSLIARMEERFGGKINVFSSEQKIPAPKGHKLFSKPRGGRLLKTITGKSTIGAKAELTLDNGEVYYASTWSWNRALGGSEPNWARLNGHVSRKISPPEPKTAPEPNSGPKLTKVRPNPASPGPPRVFALTISNSRYSAANPGQRNLNLSTTEADADLVAKSLREAGAEVKVAKNLRAGEILKSLETATRSLTEKDAFVFYYAGHALQLNGKNYLAPLGISFLDKAAVLKSAVAVDDIVSRIAELNPRFAAIILDGSRQNPFNHADPATHLLLRIPGLNLGGKTVLTQSGLAEMTPLENMLVALPAQPGAFSSRGVRAGKFSYFAAALAGNLAKNVEFRQALAQTAQQVAQWSRNRQKTWVSPQNSPPFYLQTPGRTSAPPDADTFRAGRWLADESEFGAPMALAHLARSVRTNPHDNPATAALVYLLSYQSLAVPLNDWGPFEVKAGKGKSFAKELQISLDGQQIALFPANDADQPALIVDRENGKTLDEISGIFSPAYSTAKVKFSPPSWNAPAISSVTSIRREMGDSGAQTHVITPIFARDPVVASCFDEGLERLYLATRSGDGKIRVREFATTPGVSLDPNFAKSPQKLDLQPGKTSELASGKTWKLTFDGKSGEIRLIAAGTTVYSRKGAAVSRSRLEDWSLDPAGESVILLFRNHIDAVSVTGRKLASFDLPTSGDSRKILAFSPMFQRVAVAQGKAPGARIGIYNLATGREVGAQKSRQGYPEYASLAPNHEWFFHFDESGRWRMADLASGGSKLDFPGAATASLLAGGAEGEDEDDEPAMTPIEAEPPPFFEQFADFSTAPAWLAELTESLLGFRLDDENRQPAWNEDSPQRTRSAMRQMSQGGGKSTYKSWREWFEQTRLAAIEN